MISLILLYFAVLSDLAGAPDFNWVACVPMARSAIKLSSVSPDLWLIIVFKLFLWANFIALRVSEIVPTWFGFISTVFTESSDIEVFILFIDVTKRSSPTIWTLDPISLFNFVQFSQSSWSKAVSYTHLTLPTILLV